MAPHRRTGQVRLKHAPPSLLPSKQRVVTEAPSAVENYYDYDDVDLPSHTRDGAYQLRSNYEEVYTLSLTADGDVGFASSLSRSTTPQAFSKARCPDIRVRQTGLVLLHPPSESVSAISSGREIVTLVSPKISTNHC